MSKAEQQNIRLIKKLSCQLSKKQASGVKSLQGILILCQIEK